MLPGRVQNLVAYVSNAGGAKEQADPEQLYLKLRGERHQAGCAKHRCDIGQIVSAAGNHRCSRRRARRGNHCT